MKIWKQNMIKQGIKQQIIRKQYTIIIQNMSSQKHMLELVSKPNPSNHQRQQLITLLRANGTDMADCMFENAYKLYRLNPKSDQKYIQLEEIIYSGLKLKVDRNVLLKFFRVMKSRIGDNTYIRRINRFIQYITNPSFDISPMQDLLRDDLSDSETLKKTITSFKRLGRVDEYIQRLNKYVSIQPLDQQAWVQLAQIYTQKGHYMKAAFCYQQLIIINPSNDIFTLKLSELYLTLNNKSTTEKAVKYLLYLISKRPDNLRALWVLYRSIATNQQYAEVKQMCADAIGKLYSKGNPAVKFNLAL